MSTTSLIAVNGREKKKHALKSTARTFQWIIEHGFNHTRVIESNADKRPTWAQLESRKSDPKNTNLRQTFAQ